MFRMLVSDGRGGVRVAEVPRWAVWLGAAGLAAVALLILAFSLTVLIVLAPLAIAGGLIARWRLKKALREAAATPGGAFHRPSAPDGVIEGEYRVVDDRRDR